MLRLGILGCGRIGQVHARSSQLLDGVCVTAVADALAVPAEALAARTGAKVMDAYDMIAGSDVDAVIICTPTDTHFELIQAAAASGKAILCEKPVDMSVANIEACVTAVEAAGVPFMTGFNRRFDPSFANLQARLRADEIGSPEIVTILSRDPSPPPLEYIARSGGIFRDMMIHDLDMARFLLDEEIVQVFTVGASLFDPDIGAAGDFDTTAAVLTTASGKICQISNSRRATYGYDQRIEVHGSTGMLRAANILENSVELGSAQGFHTAPAQAFFLERYELAYRIEMAHFVKAIAHGIAPVPDIRDGLQAQRLANAAARSAETGLPVILSANDRCDISR